MRDKMKFETISVTINKKDEIENVKKALKIFKSTYPNVQIAKPRFGELSGKILITFKVDANYSTDLILSFAKNYINVLATTDVIKKKIDFATAKYAETLARQSKGWADMKIEQPEMSISELESYAQEGMYEEIIRIANDLIHYGEKIVEKAKNVLDLSVDNAIEKAYQKAKENQDYAEEAINKLIKVASDSRLRTMNKIKLSQNAGLKAIDLINEYPNYILKLVDITNNPDIHNYVNIAAFINFGNIVIREKERFEKEINEGARKLNLRWIEIAYDVAHKLLNEDEKSSYERTLRFIKNRKTKEKNE